MKIVDLRARFAVLPALLTFVALFNSATADALDPRKAITQYSHQVWQAREGLPQNSIHAMLQTRDGYLWLGTQEGLVRFDGVQFTVFDRSNTPWLRSNYVQALLEDRDGGLWIGTNGGGVTRRKDETSLTASTHEGLAGDQVNCLFEDRGGGVWIGTTAGLSRFVSSALHFGRDSAGGPEQGHPLDRRGSPWRDLDRDGGRRAAAPARRALDAREDRRTRQEPDPGDRQGPQREPVDRNRRRRPRELEGGRRGPLLGVERPGGQQDPVDPRGPRGEPLDRHRRRGALAPGRRKVDLLLQGPGPLEQLGRIVVRGPRRQPLDRDARRRAQPPLRRKLHALRIFRRAELRRRVDLPPDAATVRSGSGRGVAGSTG